MNIKKLVKPNIRKLKAYHAAEVPCKIKLDANESPYGLKVLGSVMTNRYPDPEAKELRSLAAKDLGVNPENILHGNGSDELIYCLIAAFGGPVLFPVPTFSMYGIIAQSLDQEYTGIPLDNRFDIDMKPFEAALRKLKPRLTFLSSPNNPTGNSFSSVRIEKIIQKSKGIVVVDEAYQPFSERKSFIPLLKKYDNLVILRTLSKVGLAGLRTGFMIAGTEINEEVNKVRLPFNLNSLSQKVAVDALKKNTDLKKFITAITDERKNLMAEMKKIRGIRPYPTDANFILFHARDASSLHARLLKQGVLIRDMTGALPDCLRVTVGTSAENKAFLKALSNSL